MLVVPNKVAYALACASILLARSAAASDCAGSADPSSCIDANSLWLRAGRARFLALTPVEPLGESQASAGVAASYLSRPVVLSVSSPDPEGRDIRVVDHVVDVSVLVAYAATRRFELSLVSPLTVYQSGAGVAGLTSQSAPPLSPSAARDPRVGATYQLLSPADGEGVFSRARLEFGLPLGDASAFAGEAGPTVSPGVANEVVSGRWFAGLELGLRLRESSTLAGSRLGNQLELGLGAGVNVFRELLSLSLEAHALPALNAQKHLAPDGSDVDATLIPAEALLGVRSLPVPDLILQLGGGLGLPLSSETRDGETKHFAGVTTPRFRVMFAVRYVPPGESERR